MSDSAESGDTLCQHGECTAPATAIYEGVIEPGATIRFRSCSDHAPDIQPIERLEVTA